MLPGLLWPYQLTCHSLLQMLPGRSIDELVERYYATKTHKRMAQVNAETLALPLALTLTLALARALTLTLTLTKTLTAGQRRASHA